MRWRARGNVLFHNEEKPAQARARATIDTILEATARIIEGDGFAALNTNRIAERAGIGTLYEYCPNKDAIRIAMARKRLAEDERVVRQALAGAEVDLNVSLVRCAIRTMVALNAQRFSTGHAERQSPAGDND